MKRFGYYVRLGGDREISEALARGAKGAMVPLAGSSSEAVRRVAMMKHTPEEWDQMTRKARKKYGTTDKPEGISKALLVGYAMICMGVSWLYHKQKSVLK